jgi:uncharacterized protein YaiI (UPF0178 family)
MHIWIDADACPRAVKEMLYRASERRQIMTTLVANTPLRIPASPYLDMRVVAAGTDRADDEIVALLSPGDLVITADIPLAADAVAKGAIALNPRGMLYTRDNVHAILSIRNLKEELRGIEEVMGGPPPFSNKDKQAFANQLEKILNAAR